jgi:hypothetical protein
VPLACCPVPLLSPLVLPGGAAALHRPALLYPVFPFPTLEVRERLVKAQPVMASAQRLRAVRGLVPLAQM